MRALMARSGGSCDLYYCNMHTHTQSFDELLLLKPGGETIFSGLMGPGQAHLINHFESVEGVEQ